MKTTFITLLLLASITIITAREVFIINTGSQTLSKVNVDNFTTNNAFAQIGNMANQTIYYNQKLYVVNSGDHSIQVINATSGASQGNILLENECNPWNIAIHNNFIYVTGYDSNTLYKIDLNNYGNRSDLNIGTSPTGLLAYNNKLFVSVTNETNYQYGQGYVKVVELSTFQVVHSIPVPTNPNQMIADPLGNIHLVCSGDFAGQYATVKIFNSLDYSNIYTINFNCYLASIHLSPNGIVYLTDAMQTNFCTYNATTYQTGTFNFTNPFYLTHDTQYVYIIESDWWTPSRLHIYTHAMSPVQIITLGVGAVHIETSEGSASDADLVVKPEQLQVSMFPNPFAQKVRIEVKNASIGTKIALYNTKGQKIAEQYGKDYVWNGSDVTGQKVANGIYFVQVSNQNGCVVKKVVKM